MKIKEKVLKEAQKGLRDQIKSGLFPSDMFSKVIDLTLAEVIKKIRGYIEYRGGMGNRIDAWDVIDLIEGKKPEVDKFIEEELK